MRAGAARALSVVAALDAAALLLMRISWWPGLRATGIAHAVAAESPERTLPLLLAVAFAVLSAWLTAVVLLALIGNGRLARRLTPRLLRLFVEALVGATAAATLAATPALAATGSAPTGNGLAATSLDRPAIAVTARPAPDLDRPADPRPARPSPAVVVVRPGDSLWRIAARALPRGSSDDDVERAWHRWYAANRAVIGPDPGLLQPGQQLVNPGR